MNMKISNLEGNVSFSAKGQQCFEILHVMSEKKMSFQLNAPRVLQCFWNYFDDFTTV